MEDSYTVSLLDTETGKTADVVFRSRAGDEDDLVWFWSDGNYGCDCNRAIELYGGELDAECNMGHNSIHVTAMTRMDGSAVELPDDINE